MIKTIDCLETAKKTWVDTATAPRIGREREQKNKSQMQLFLIELEIVSVFCTEIV